MIRRNKKKLILTSLVTLLPIAMGLLLRNRLPEKIATHLGFDGQPDSYSSRPFAIFVLPLVALAAHWLCVFCTAKDPKNQDRNYKPLGMVLWIMPIVSNLSSAMMFSLALGIDFSVIRMMSLLLGLLFLVLGNYLPKCRQNYTIGIKVYWTYTSEENWNATHRFGGRVWMLGGVVILLSAFLPLEVGIPVLIAATFILAILPSIYSWLYYRKQKARGDTLTPIPHTYSKLSKGAWILVAALLLFVAAMLFTGSIRISFGETAFTIEASYYDDLTVDYASIDTIEYREGDVDGVRNWGVDNFRLLLGCFENEEFGAYTRYTYHAPEACIVLTANGKTLVISGRDALETRTIYNQLLLRMEGLGTLPLRRKSSAGDL